MEFQVHLNIQVSHLAYVIINARKSHHSLIVTLLDLPSAFYEVHHNLTDYVLEHHHVPEDIGEIVNNSYCCFKTSVLTDGFVADFVNIKKSVLQRNCFSPLMFNLRYLSLGQWYQFADDVAGISGLESENQILPNFLSRWYSCADMIIRVDKCHTFGIKKSGTSSKQFQPKMYLPTMSLSHQESKMGTLRT